MYVLPSSISDNIGSRLKQYLFKRYFKLLWTRRANLYHFLEKLMPNNRYILYGTANCHLCEDAIDLIHLSDADLDLSVIDIVDDSDLYARYELTIPILKSSTTEAELNWPFSLESLQLFLSNNK
jgi:hypothetical protein